MGVVFSRTSFDKKEPKRLSRGVICRGHPADNGCTQPATGGFVQDGSQSRFRLDLRAQPARNPWPTPLTVARKHWSASTHQLWKDLHAVQSDLNGCNGEWTNEDCRPKKGNSVLQQMGQMAKNVAAEAAKAALRQAKAEARIVGGKAISKVEARLPRLVGRLRKIVGSGDYAVSDDTARNALVTGKIDTNMSFGSLEKTRFAYRESLGAVLTGATAGKFNATEYPIQPGSALTFPYLSALAEAFEEYAIMGLVFEFVSSSSNYSAAGSLGTVAMTYTANPTAQKFTSLGQLENTNNAVSSRFDVSSVCGVECRKGESSQNTYFVRTSQNNSTLPITSTDMGKFTVATQPGVGYATSSIIGELWVTYVVEFYKPRQAPGRFGYFHKNIGLPTVAAPLGTGGITTNVAYGAASSVTTSSTAVTIPQSIQGDTWLFLLYWTGITPADVQVPTYTITGGTAQPIWANGAAQMDGGSDAVLGDTLSLGLMVTVESVTANPTTLTLNANGTYPSGPSSVDVFLINVGNGFTGSSL